MTDPIPFPIRPKPVREEAAHETRAENEDSAFAVGHNLRRLRTRRGYSLGKLAKLSGVSRAMLSQIELGRSVPSINVVFKIARTFEVPFSAMLAAAESFKGRVLPASDAKVLFSASGEFSTRALFPFDALRKTEFYELRLAPRGTETAEAHAVGTMENLVVVHGRVEIKTRSDVYRLTPGDALLFQADDTHSYENLTETEALLYLVMTYCDSTG